MRGKTLDALLDDFRAEIRLSLNPAHNVQLREVQIKRIQQAQDWLWSDYDWPQLKARKTYPINAGQRLYDVSADFDIDRIQKIAIRANNEWLPVFPGIDDEAYAVFDSDLDQRSWPPRRWQIAEDEQIEFWPIPDQNGSAVNNASFQVTGIRKLNPLIADSDRADLDDRLIVLYAAAEHLAAAGAKDAPLKLDKANKRMARLRGGMTKVRSFQMFGVGRREPQRRHVISNYKPAV